MSHGSLLKKGWLVPVLVAILLTAHAFIFYRVQSRMAWSLVLGLVLLVVLKHVGVLGPIYAFRKRRSRQ